MEQIQQCPVVGCFEDNIKIYFGKTGYESMEQIQQCPMVGCYEDNIKIDLVKTGCESMEQTQQCPVVGFVKRQHGIPSWPERDSTFQGRSYSVKLETATIYTHVECRL
jgi:hypothetical protein